MNEKQYEMVVCIVNAGFSQNVVEAARTAGARGGTVIRARGTANPEAEEFFNIHVQPEKEVVMMLVPKDIKDEVMRTVYKEAGLAAEAQGIAFSMPVTHTTTIKEKE